MKKLDAHRRASGLRVTWRVSCVACALGLAGCAVQPPQAPVPLALPTQWQAPLPHNGKLTDLAQWWQQQGDPVLVELIMAAEAVSPTIATARVNIEEAREARAIAGAALLPTLDASYSATRSLSPPVLRTTLPIATTRQLGVQASWETDLFGQRAATRDADQQRLVGAEAMWHAARVSVAAETANQYDSLRACDKLLAVARADAASRLETARLTELGAKAGFQAPAAAALARASAAEGRGSALQQGALCDIDVKGLVALTGLAETELRQKLAGAPADTGQESMAPVVSVPAEVLAQRPDIFNAAREVDAAHLSVGSARALRYPRLTLAGDITGGKTVSRGFSQAFNTWSVGPIQLSLPLFDGGASQAHVEAAQARYENAAAQYRGSVRQAVREVEEALVNLQSTAERKQDAAVAAEGYQASFSATQARYQSGLASLVELEESRRTQLAAQSAVVSLQRERRGAWVALYRALGGGWSSTSPGPARPGTDVSATAPSAATTP
jgi:NodT family efflux transporter outer membrane factor (OMF) lipoprotein